MLMQVDAMSRHTTAILGQNLRSAGLVWAVCGAIALLMKDQTGDFTKAGLVGQLLLVNEYWEASSNIAASL